MMWCVLLLVSLVLTTWLRVFSIDFFHDKVTIFICNWYLSWEGVFSSVQSLSHIWLIATPWTATCQASLSITNSWSPPKPMTIESVVSSNHLIFCLPLFHLPSIFLIIRVFQMSQLLTSGGQSLSFKISPSNEHPGLISFRMDWLDLLAAQGTLKSLLQHHSATASIPRHSVFFYPPTLTSIHDHWKNHSFD